MRYGVGASIVAAASCAMIAASPHAAGAKPAPIPVIIDTDIGDDIDDAFALALAIRDPRLEVVGVTTAFGDTAKRVLLVRRLLRAMGRSDIPVAQGVVTADPTPFSQRDWAEAEADRSPAPDALDFIATVASARPGEITLLALAPLTTIAAMVRTNMAAYRHLDRVVMMGGSIHQGYVSDGSGPAAPTAEYNVAQAPDAFTAVLGAGVPLVLFPLDATQVRLERAGRDILFAHGSLTSDSLAALYEQWRVGNAWGQSTATLFDVVPVAWVAEPGLCVLQPLRIEVDAAGWTRPVPGEPNVQVCLDHPGDAISKDLIRALTE